MKMRKKKRRQKRMAMAMTMMMTIRIHWLHPRGVGAHRMLIGFDQSLKTRSE